MNYRNDAAGPAVAFCVAWLSDAAACAGFTASWLKAETARRRRAGIITALVILVALLALASLGIGPVRLSPLTGH